MQTRRCQAAPSVFSGGLSWQPGSYAYERTHHGRRLFLIDNTDSDWKGLRYLKQVQAPAGIKPTLKC